MFGFTGSERTQEVDYMNYTILLVLTLLLGCAYKQFEELLIDDVPLDEITVATNKKPEWPTHYFLCKRLYPNVGQHGKFMRCIRSDI